MAVDTGYLSNTVYNFCRFRPINTIAVKGVNTAGRTSIITKPSNVDVTWEGNLIKDGCQLWPVSVDPAKSQIYSRLGMVKDGPGFYHFPIGLDDEYYLQLTAEKKITKYRNGFEVYEWAKLRDRNDVLDAEVYALAAAIRGGLLTVTDWQAVKASQTGKGSAAAGSDDRPKRAKNKRSRW